MPQKRGLGKGLDALFSGAEEEYGNASGTSSSSIDAPLATDAKPTEIGIDKIFPNPDQPRKHFDEVAMSDLVNSIRIHGVISPAIVVKSGSGFMIIAGERRWRAAKSAGLRQMPVVVREYTKQQIKELSLIENLQREDLNPIETANAIKELMESFRLTQEEVAERIGKSRSAVANTLRLLTLSRKVIALVSDGRLHEGHARCLVVVKDEDIQYKLAVEGLDGRMTARDFEKRVKYFLNPPPIKTVMPNQSLELKDLVTRMQRVFATKVSAIGNDKKGRINIDYFTRDDLDRLEELVEVLEQYKNNK